MMDDDTLELLSRAVDEDLDEETATRLERRLEREPALASELATFRAARAAVARLASTMEPPEDLDRTLVPLRRSSPPERRPSRVWMAAAAAVVAIGLGAAYQLGRQQSQPSPSLQALRDVAKTPVPERPQYYQLRPLPTSTVSESERPVGVGERLLATPDRMPDSGPGDPLVVLGPLPWASPPSGRLTVATDRTVMVAAVPYAAACGSAAVRADVSVEDGVIVGAQVHGGDLGDDDAATCAAALIGATVEGFADGVHRGRLNHDPEPSPGP